MLLTFFLGLLLGSVSGTGTYAFTGHGQLAAAVGVIVFLACWLGIAAIVWIDD
ncbi:MULTISPECIES: hypothetical protein [Streptomyces]|uniref:Uncharacterized protein n=2 Tax=Streptomyces rimosus subsp. rimosus TaxID=132474 RepID=A0A8A1UJ53_STRR1|nr:MULTISPECIES: hypothetical protein [Streptomyces]MYT44908.1 hypothetical protein [Streptomyces sp. SID5471]QGY70392.1 hypothetical protein V519_034995 [Streptomyces rimosus R6-500]QST80756.1 hypothetical protein SRIM_011725 [Streptomyces rimosus subsp. rimosus ATCC 10970]UNZ06245.1 hypothetical protein SRIMR7_29265 [Streptomyces rimosus subsp. rimosus]UTH97701.1 hypothetical protein SRIMHP_26640 [Streptomyces rimosus subsp. rimosus]